MRLETSGPPIILFSTYWPYQDSTSALQQRDNIAFDKNQVISSQRCIPIILGDMNTTLKENDRSSHFSYRKDAHYQKFTQDNHLVPIDYNLAKRHWTFSMRTSSALNSHTITRLGDILLPSALVKNQRHPQPFWYPDDRGCKHSDHIPLIASIPLSSLGVAVKNIQQQTPATKREKVLLRPF